VSCVATAVVLERVAGAVVLPAVGLDEEALVGEEEVDPRSLRRRR
jgi:hypothetical protein